MTLENSAYKLVQSAPGSANLAAFADRLRHWLEQDLLSGEGQTAPVAEQIPGFTESRAKALLRALEIVDDPTLNDFARLMENESAARVALFDLLVECNLAEEAGAASLIALPAPDDQGAPGWLSLAVAAQAWKSGYLLHQFDPASPPGAYSPAGQVLKRAAQFLRRQVQRSATERDQLARHLAYRPGLVHGGTPSLEELPEGASIPPLPPHFRPPVPERYPEIAPETLQVDPDEVTQPPVIRGEPLVITEDDLAETGGADEDVVRMPPISIPGDQVSPVRHSRQRPETRPPSSRGESRPPSPLPGSGVIMPNSSAEPRPSFTMAVRQMLGHEEMTTTRLKITVQRYPDGPGLYGLQVRVSSQGVKSYVAGTTDRDGHFVCELPVRLHTGITYDVELTWPRDEGGDIERKSVTVNADRTEFRLPFYRRLTPADS